MYARVPVVLPIVSTYSNSNGEKCFEMHLATLSPNSQPTDLVPRCDGSMVEQCRTQSAPKIGKVRQEEKSVMDLGMNRALEGAAADLWDLGSAERKSKNVRSRGAPVTVNAW